MNKEELIETYNQLSEKSDKALNDFLKLEFEKKNIYAEMILTEIREKFSDNQKYFVYDNGKLYDLLNISEILNSEENMPNRFSWMCYTPKVRVIVKTDDGNRKELDVLYTSIVNENDPLRGL